jgi:VanZ family protein
MFLRPTLKCWIFYWLPFFFWLGVIFYFSSLPGSAYPTFRPELLLERKGAHVGEYIILTGLIFRIVNLYLEKKNRAIAMAAVFSLAFAVSDEVHQLFVPGREGKISDVGIDGIGILICVGVIYFWKRPGIIRKSIKK